MTYRSSANNRDRAEYFVATGHFRGDGIFANGPVTAHVMAQTHCRCATRPLILRNFRHCDFRGKHSSDHALEQIPLLLILLVFSAARDSRAFSELRVQLKALACRQLVLRPIATILLEKPDLSRKYFSAGGCVKPLVGSRPTILTFGKISALLALALLRVDSSALAQKNFTRALGYCSDLAI